MAITDFSISLPIVCVALSACVFLLFQVLRKRKGDPNEPPNIASSIPWIGHLIGLLWYKNRYYTRLSIFIMGTKIYVVNSPDVIRATERHPKTVSFWYVEANATSKIAGLSPEASQTIIKNASGDHSENNLFHQGLNEIHQVMKTSGSGVRRMLNVTAQHAVRCVGDLGNGAKSTRIDLWAWVQHEITVMTSNAVYGPMNPYHDVAIENSFWAFADDTMKLLPGILPSLIAPKGYAGRETVVSAFQRYFATLGHESGSDLIKVRYKVLQRGFSPEDIARFECTNGFAILLNSVPTAFWTIYHIYSDPNLLQKVRAEIEAISIVEKGDDDNIVRSIQLQKLTEIPLLTSIIQESLRLRTTGVGPRMVLEDTMLNNQYLLKKDSYLMIPNEKIHSDHMTWGNDAAALNAQRFMPSSEKDHHKKKVPTAAFRGFGGGVNLCPGKGFATGEISILVALLVAKYDLSPVNGAGEWNNPSQDLSNMSLSIAPPKNKVVVTVKPRDMGCEYKYLT